MDPFSLRSGLTVPRTFALSAVLVLFVSVLGSVEDSPNPFSKDKFKSCAQSGFCRRHRGHADLRASHSNVGPSWTVDPNSVDVSKASKGLWTATLNSNMDLDPVLDLKVMTLVSGSIRVQITNPKDTRPMFDTGKEFALSHTPVLTSYSHSKKHKRSELLVGDHKVTISFAPFMISLADKDQPDAIVFNSDNLFRFESGRPTFPKPADEDSVEHKYYTVDNDGFGEESFKTHVDPKPNGARTFGFDLSFPQTAHVYGLAEHATDFNLPSTKGKGAKYDEPFRLYNLDVAWHLTDSPMTLYGSVPFMVTQGTHGSGGALLLSASEMWIDIERKEDQLLAHWFAESSPLDLIMMAGPNMGTIHKEYMRLTGYPTLPAVFATAYHQCRWNYMSETDIAQVDAGLDKLEIPYDMLWLDIEHTDGKRFFTWDKINFPTPRRMIDAIAAKGRKMVTIIDPHIKVDDKYHVYQEGKEQDLFVKNPKGDQSFHGQCWPDESTWVDFFDKKAREWWASLFALDKYKGSSLDLFTWNDMNEPSVFDGPEITFPKNLRHSGGHEHRDVHNLYGPQEQRATHLGHLMRTFSNTKEMNKVFRPFVLTRAFFPGTQRYGAVWTGDNKGNWEHLALSTSMLLSLSTSGITFSGADVGGFFLNPEPELIARWYATGAFQPFFRAHAHIETKRREPWLFNKKTQKAIQAAVRRRYRWLPTMYTAFFDAWRTGSSILRPLVMEFPNDKKVWDMQTQSMVGPNILIAPVTAPGVSTKEVYLPAASAWYEVGSPGEPWTYVECEKKKGRTITVSAPLNNIPMFVRAGSIVVSRERIRRASTLGLTDPLTVYVALNAQGEAHGRVVIDDGVSYGVLGGGVVDVELSAKNGKLSAKLGLPKVNGTGAGEMPDAIDIELPSQQRVITMDEKIRSSFMAKFGGVRVERVVIVSPTEFEAKAESGVVAGKGNKKCEARREKKKHALVVKEPGFLLKESAWTMTYA